MCDEDVERQIAAAVTAGDVEKARSTLQAHSTLLHHDHGVGTWLHRAACDGNLAMVKMLVEMGSDVNRVGHRGFFGTPLHCAVSRDHPHVAKFLLAHGADPNHDDIVIDTAVGSKKHSLELVKLLEQYGADLHKVYFHEQLQRPMNALSMAILWDKPDVAEYLRSRGVQMPPPPEHPPRIEENGVVAYFTQHFGEPKPQALIEIVPVDPPIAVHVIPPTAERNTVVLFTTGMSDEPMTVPGDPDSLRFAYAEVFIELPGDWPMLGGESDPVYGWPFHWLRSMARYPHQNDTWLGGAVAVVDNDDPPKPLAPNLLFTSILLLAEREFTHSDGRIIQLYRLVPLYPEERNLERREGVAPLLRALDRIGSPLIVTPNRTNAGE